MAIVRSLGKLQSIADPYGAPSWSTSSAGAINVYGYTQTYGALYKAQPNVRTVVDFLGRNVAQLGLHVFRRLTDTDRERLADHEISDWLHHPNPGTTRFRLIESTMIDLGIYFNAYWLKVRTSPMGLVRLPPDQMRVEGVLVPTQFVWTTIDGRETVFQPSEIVHFGGYNPEHTCMGLSPLETLRRVLAEEYAAGSHRESMWRNAARISGVVTRPRESGTYTPDQAKEWRRQWQAMHAGDGAVGTALLQGGETFTPTAWSARDSEYVAARKLSREECAAAYHVPLPMVGILDHATFSNIKEQHKHLYQDCLGPWLVMIAEELERQLLIECEDQERVYLEFNIAEKLKGSFEEQAAALQTLVGRPVMTVDEGRSRLNLRSTGDPEDAKVAKPLNMSGADSSNPEQPAEADDAAAVGAVLEATHARMHARLAKVPVSERLWAFDANRWERELIADLAPLIGETQAQAMAASDIGDVKRRLEHEATHV